MTSENIKQAFSATGLVPASLAELHLRILQEFGIDSLEGYSYALNPGDVDLLPDRLTPAFEILARQATPLEATPELIPVNTVDLPPPPFLPLPQPLEHLNVEEVAGLGTIESFPDFLHVKELVLNSFPTMEASTFAWKQHFLIQTLLHFGEQQYHRRLEVENENSALKKKVQREKNPQKRRRGCLPDTGQAWQSKNDIASYFSMQTTAERTRKKVKLEKLQNNIPHLEKSLDTAEQKFRDRINKENQKRLPTNQLSSTRIHKEQVLPAVRRLEGAREYI
ncbi:hypothetical protein HOY80DRAFT_1006480 [Tuber brumale]|nr:hypothetical protein HOY80DRAFT_1006480 [Tuber brumale]